MQHSSDDTRGGSNLIRAGFNQPTRTIPARTNIYGFARRCVPLDMEVFWGNLSHTIFWKTLHALAYSFCS